MQQLSVNLTIPIPADSVLISKIELEQLRVKELEGVYWNMKDLESRTNKKSEWIKERILYPSKFRNKIDVDSGGFVYYPKVKGELWTFQASKMAKFLDMNFQAIFKK
jgi:phage pi2 protein 07